MPAPSRLLVFNLVLALFVKLAAVVALAAWGISTAWPVPLGLGAPMAFALLWGRFAAPRSRRRLQGGALLAFKAAAFALALLALLGAGHVRAAALFAAVAIPHLVLLGRLGDKPLHTLLPEG